METEHTNPVKGRGIRPALSLSRHWRTSAFLALLLFVVGLPVVWIKGQSVYVAETVFQVSPNFQKNLSGDKELEFQSNSQYREFVNHLSRSVLRYDIVDKALQQMRAQGKAPCGSGESTRRCIERLQRTIYILPIADTYMVRVGLSSYERGISDQIVNAVMTVFLETVRDEQIFGSGMRADVLKQREQQLRVEIRTLEQQRADLAGQLGLTTFAETVTNPYDVLLARAREQLSVASIDRSRAQASLAAFEQQREVPVQGGRSVLEMRLQDNGLQALRNEVVKRSEELSRVLQGITPNHPAADLTLQERIDIHARLQNKEKEFEKGALENMRARFTASFMQAQQVEADLIAEVKRLEGLATTFASLFREAMQVTADMRKREQELNDIRDRSNFLRTERDAIGFARLITPALPATIPQGVGHARLLLALLLATGLVFLAVPLLIDYLDRRVTEVSDAERVMGMPAAAWFVQVQGAVTELLSQQQFKRFASTLLRNRKAAGDGVFAVTSVRVGGGASLVVQQMGQVLKALGARVLVIQANTLAHRPVAAPAVLGLCEYLAGQARLEEIVQQRPDDHPDADQVLLGERPGAGLQRLDRLRVALDHWRSQYDLVLLDVPPLLPSADAELLIDVAGQVFMVVEAMTVTKAELKRVRWQLSKLSPRAVGLVVNKVPLEHGGADVPVQVVESLTSNPFARFMSISSSQLRLQLLGLQAQRVWTGWLERARIRRRTPGS